MKKLKKLKLKSRKQHRRFYLSVLGGIAILAMSYIALFMMAVVFG